MDGLTGTPTPRGRGGTAPTARPGWSFGCGARYSCTAAATFSLFALGMHARGRSGLSCEASKRDQPVTKSTCCCAAPAIFGEVSRRDRPPGIYAVQAPAETIHAQYSRLNGE